MFLLTLCVEVSQSQGGFEVQWLGIYPRPPLLPTFQLSWCAENLSTFDMFAKVC